MWNHDVCVFFSEMYIVHYIFGNNFPGNVHDIFGNNFLRNVHNIFGNNFQRYRSALKLVNLFYLKFCLTNYLLFHS